MKKLDCSHLSRNDEQTYRKHSRFEDGSSTLKCPTFVRGWKCKIAGCPSSCRNIECIRNFITSMNPWNYDQTAPVHRMGKVDSEWLRNKCPHV